LDVKTKTQPARTHAQAHKPIISEGIAPGMLSVNQASHYLGIAKSTCYGLFRDGRIRSIMHGRRRLVPTQELNAYIARLIADEYGDDPPAA
jgi:excisionase family DNA binding protein